MLHADFELVPWTVGSALVLRLSGTLTEPDLSATAAELTDATAERFAAELDRFTLGGSHRVTVDLTGVTHLAGAAVSVLHRRRGSLVLYAPAGTVADHVLGLDHHTTDPDRPSPTPR